MNDDLRSISARVEPALLRKLNERRVLELIQQQGPCSRAGLTRLSGMSPPTVSKAVAALLEAGLLEETQASATTFGRPAKLIRLAAARTSVLGIVIEPELCWVVVSGLDGRIHSSRMRSFPVPGTYQHLLDQIENEVNRLRDEGTTEIRSVGITVPGLLHQGRERVLFSPNLHLLDGQMPGLDLSQRLQLPCVALQESHALCVGERMFGDAQGLSDFAMLDVSTGLGLGVMSGGRLLTGHGGLAGELGHITVELNGRLCGCGNRGCLETLATDAALARAVSARLGRSFEIRELVGLIRTGEIDARQELDQVTEYLAIAFAAVINLFNPAAFFVHGVLFEAAEDLFQNVVHRTQSRALGPSLTECRIIQARGNKRQAAVAGALQHLTQSWAPTLS